MRTDPNRTRRAAALAAVALLALAGCSSGGGDGDDAGAGEDGGAVQIAGGPSVAVTEDDGDGAANTIPLAADEDVSISDVTSSFEVFTDCATEMGWEFQGRPDPESDDPVLSDPAYLDAMSTCANRSGIVEKMEALGDQQADLTPEEIEEQNTAVLAMQDCLRGKGWDWPDMERTENGALNVFSSPPSPPDDTSVFDIFEHPDFTDCQEEIAAELDIEIDP